MSSETEVRAVIGEMIAAIAAKDSARVIATFSDDIAAFDLAPPLVQPSAAVREPAALDEWFATWSDTVELGDRELHVEADGDLAAAWSLRKMTGTKHEGGPQRLWYRWTAILRRRGGEWRIAHMHESVPFAMDGSGKALLDLQP